MNKSSLKPIVEMRNITKVFPGVRALDNVNFQIFPSDIRGLVGKNGAGKSTLMSILTGIYPPNSGEILINGEPIHHLDSTKARELGISIVHQQSQLIAPLSMAENIFCGKLPKNKLGLVDWKKLYQEAQERIKLLGLQIDVKRQVEGASVAERQMIEIVKALFSNAKIVILDEPTAPLPKSEVELLFSFIRKLCNQGVGLVYISHYLEEVFQLCDTVTVLRDGKNAGDFKVTDLSPNKLIDLISGTKVENFKRTVTSQKRDRPVLDIKGLNRGEFYQDINLSFNAGEIVGITGLDGCGKDSLAKGIFGLEQLGNGEVKVGGKLYQKADEPKDAFMQGVAYLPRDRHGYGIFGLRPVRENITLPILKQILNKLGFLDLAKERKHCSHLIDQLNIRTPSQEQPVQFLSGGNQQKVVFAKLIGVQPKVLWLDEPTQGVDVQAKIEILKIIEDLANNNVCVIIISEEIHELLDICDRILVLFQGRISHEFKMGDPKVSVQKILHAVEGTKQKEFVYEKA